MSDLHVAIIGGGFSGTLVAANIVAEAQVPLTIHIFDTGEEIAQGAAYGTREPGHLLNVRADRMGAFADKPDGFWQWLQSEEGEAASLRIESKKIAANDFAPRMLYAAYLQSIWQHMLTRAEEKSIAFHVHFIEVIDAKPSEKGFELKTTQGDSIRADKVVLATGNLKPRSFHFKAEFDSRYIADSWQMLAGNINIEHIAGMQEVVIIGTGLTTVDAILTLLKRGYEGKITAISRNGWFPQPHAACASYPAWGWQPQTALELLTGLRREVRIAAEKGYDWRAVIDSLRPVTQKIWHLLQTNEKKRFFKKLFTLWNIHRHRMAPELYEKLRLLQEQGILQVIAGKILDIQPEKSGLAVAYQKRRFSEQQIIRAQLVINCTGPDYHIAASGHALLTRLLEKGLITQSPVGVGIVPLSNQIIYPIGTLLVGELLECTAVPELREQAREVALRILQH